MIVGVTKEIKDHEYRVGLTPGGVQELVGAGHTVLAQAGAGAGSGLRDDQYEAAGAVMLSEAAAVFAEADLIVKVKEPLPQEYGYLPEGQALFTFLHLAPNPELTQALLERRTVAIAYETVQLDDGRLPLLKPMSEVAGKMAIQVGARLLERTRGGSGVLLGGVAGVEPGKVVILGGGVVGMNAAKVAHGLGADVLIVDLDLDRLRYLEDLFHGHVHTLTPTRHNVAKAVAEADLLVGAVLVPGARAPVLVTREMLRTMRPGSVVVDVAIDQGGCVETSRPTSHSEPTYVEEGVIHYCVPNIPGAVSRTSTFALTNATLPYVVALAMKGIEQALEEDPALARGLNLHGGQVTCQAVADSLST
ncbi:MAG: alanine dehydrogenase [Candidatus Tectimicrobiota bacterium]